VDFVQHLLTVREQVTTKVRRDYFGLPKGGKPRVLKMRPRLEDALGQLLRHKSDEAGAVMPTSRVVASTEARFVIAPYVRTGGAGRPISEQTIQDSMKRVHARAGVKGAGKVHNLRHTFCSHLAMRGASPIQIMVLAGHEDFKTTKRYLHLCPKVRDEGIDLLDASA
jgi:site-specific recombinase XerD